MAKHPHRLLLNQKKTWRCTLPGCKYFIHMGLAHILPGHQSICWGCNEEFTLDEEALKDDQPKCNDCRMRDRGESPVDLDAYINTKLLLAKEGVKTVKEVSQTKRNTLKAMGINIVENDEVEVIEPNEEN